MHQKKCYPTLLKSRTHKSQRPKFEVMLAAQAHRERERDRQTDERATERERERESEREKGRDCCVTDLTPYPSDYVCSSCFYHFRLTPSSLIPTGSEHKSSTQTNNNNPPLSSPPYPLSSSKWDIPRSGYKSGLGSSFAMRRENEVSSRVVWLVVWSGRAPAAAVVTKDGCSSCCCWRPLRLRGSYDWRRVRLQRRTVAGAAAYSDLGLAEAAVTAPATDGGGCDCGWGLCGSYCCWRPLRLTAGAEGGHCYAAGTCSCRSGC